MGSVSMKFTVSQSPLSVNVKTVINRASIEIDKSIRVYIFKATILVFIKRDKLIK